MFVSKLAALVAALFVSLLAGCGGSSSTPATPALSVTEDADGGLTIRSGGVPLGRVSLSAWNLPAGAADGVRVTPSGGKLNIVVGTPGQANLAVGLFADTSLVLRTATLDVQPSTYRGRDSQGFWYWEVPKGTSDLVYSVIVDAGGSTTTHQRIMSVEVADAPAAAVPTVKLFAVGGSSEVTEVTVGTTIEARLENADELRIIQPDGLVVTMVPNGGKVTFVASQTTTAEKKYRLTPLKGSTAGITVGLDVKAGTPPGEPTATAQSRRPVRW